MTIQTKIGQIHGWIVIILSIIFSFILLVLSIRNIYNGIQNKCNGDIDCEYGKCINNHCIPKGVRYGVKSGIIGIILSVLIFGFGYIYHRMVQTSSKSAAVAALDFL